GQGGSRNFDGLEVKVADDANGGPAVNAQLDASMSMVMLRDDESGSDKGLQDAIRRLQAMCQVSEALGNILDQEALMQKIIDSIFDLFPAADRAFIMLRDKDADGFVPVAARKRGGDDTAADEAAISRTIIEEVVNNKRSILSSDAMSDDRFSSQVSIANLSIRSMMCAPLLVGGDILGLIQVDTQRGVRTFTEEDLEVLTGISAQAAISVKNAQLYEAVEMETSRRTSLQRYFSPNMVELMMSGDVNTELGGKTYTGTVFMSDIIGFTPMSETMDPAELVAKLNRYFTVMQKIIYDNGGNVDKFEGDAIMAFWSVPRHVDGDEVRAVLTGVEMQAKLWPFNVEMEADGQSPIHMGIGLNSGSFVAGNVGSEDKIEFTLIGDNVNLAARIEGRAGRTQVLAAESTYEAAGGELAAVRLPPTMLKGKSKPIAIYSIRGVRRGAEEWALNLPCVHAGDGTDAGLLTAMSGTGAEVRLLLSSQAAVAQGARLRLAVTLTEHHEPLPFEATVEAANVLEIRPELTYTRAVLNEVAGDAILGFLQPGACLDTSLTWNEMQRS
ncbi:MAG: adenylate/guanylate cyclase domain-containing protein, partial [Planctomycetota bacterium]